MSAAQEFQLTAPEPRELVPAAVTPTDLLRIAVSQNVDIDKLKQLMDLQERWEKNEAKKAFVSALNQFKAHPPTIEKIKKVDFSSKSNNRVNYNYAPLDHVAKVLGSGLSQYGLSFRWNVQQADSLISVTCILQHSGGHSEGVTMSAGLHTDERMNPIQRLGSTVTYLQRYTLLAATGMATEEQDNDGGATNGELAEQLEWLANANAVELKPKFGEFYSKAKTAKNTGACQALVSVYEKRKKELAL